MKNIIRIATRNSPLALEQAKMVSSMLSKHNKIEIVSMVSSGDKVSSKEFKTLAKRPRYSLLNKLKIKKTFNLVIPDYRKSLRDCIKVIKNEA